MQPPFIKKGGLESAPPWQRSAVADRRLQGCLERLQTAGWPENFAQDDRVPQILIRPELEQKALLLRSRSASPRARCLRAEITHLEARFLHGRGREDPLDWKRWSCLHRGSW